MRRNTYTCRGRVILYYIMFSALFSRAAVFVRRVRLFSYTRARARVAQKTRANAYTCARTLLSSWPRVYTIRGRTRGKSAYTRTDARDGTRVRRDSVRRALTGLTSDVRRRSRPRKTCPVYGHVGVVSRSMPSSHVSRRGCSVHETSAERL